ncbi:hypothetical protein GBAR_LOCUS9607 [Geodia barretti]|uniref:Uncharacterized protein n=1 Tax=Geodia barretti TaxID=519541 RepID=A0AA35RS16_GEOBA|nr:hypothetical protein GBAR_LOCUS9607 [Geodia barretti]
MNTLRIALTIEDLIRELEIIDPTETSVGTWSTPEGDMRVSIIHESGHVYAIPGDDEEDGDPSLLFRLPVERMGIEAAIQAVEKHLGSVRLPHMRECDMLGCRNPVPEDQGKSVAPGTYLAVCDYCAPIVATVR